MLLLLRTSCRLSLDASRKTALRSLSTTPRNYRQQSSSEPYGAVVAGAGPGGLAVVGNLLQQHLPGQLLWLDPQFHAGLVGTKWTEVPSNTKVNLFTAFGEGTQPFQDVIAATPTPNAMTALRALDPNATCSLRYAADMIRMLSDGLGARHAVDKRLGTLRGADYDSASATWTIQTVTAPDHLTSTLSARRIVLATGSHPVDANLPVPGLQLRQLDVETALRPSRLAAFFAARPSASPPTVAVVGASHTAVLILYNLYHLAAAAGSPVPGLQIKWFTRSPLRYAEFRDGWIKRDNTGLKGLAAEWAREHLEDARRAASPVGAVVQRIDCSAGREKAAYERELPGCDVLVQAIGFQANDSVRISVDGRVVKAPVYDHERGGFVEERGGRPLPGLYGAGIAYPERVTDPEGSVEYAVGMFKFMKYLRRVVPEWVEPGRPASA